MYDQVEDGFVIHMCAVTAYGYSCGCCDFNHMFAT